MSESNPRIEQFRKMANDDPSNPMGHFSLGRELLAAEEPAEAIAPLQRVLELDPNISKVYQLLATAQLKLQMANDNPEPGGGLALDSQDRLYIVDTENQRVRRVDFAADVIETVAGNGTAGFSGDGGPATEASLAWPRDATIGPDGRLYIADTDNHRIRAVDLATGVITTVVGDGVPRFGGDGDVPTAASLNRPWGIGFDGVGNLFIADTMNNRIRKVMP